MQLFAKRLKERARFLGLSDAEVARRAGLTERRYGHYVTGEREPNLETLIKISEVLAATPNDLLLSPGKQAKTGGRPDFDERFKSALNCLSPGDRELALSQLECLVNHRAKKRSSSS